LLAALNVCTCESFICTAINIKQRENARRITLKKQQIISIFLIFAIASLAVPVSQAAETLAKPTINLPANYSEFDPAGAGMVEYTDQDDYDLVRIYYEKAQVSSYTSQQLQGQAESIFESVDVSATLGIDNSGVKQYAGVSAGFAKGYDSSSDTYKMELVFIKGDYYFNVHSYYDATTEDQNQMESVINSINVGGTGGVSFLGNPMLLIILGVVAAVIVVVIVVVVAKGRKKKSPQQAQMQNNYPPPPPPT
jgi:hypothetical protein